jgi:protein-S-isoprenylcysteine O-methyltransferase Ste14
VNLPKLFQTQATPTTLSLEHAMLIVATLIGAKWGVPILSGFAWLLLGSLVRILGTNGTLGGQQFQPAGLLRYVRHPEFTGFLLGALGSGFLSGNLYYAGTVFIAATIYARWQIFKKDRTAREYWGPIYDRYQYLTPSVFPKLTLGFPTTRRAGKYNWRKILSSEAIFLATLVLSFGILYSRTFP